jgi:hypothetical protein
VDFAEIKVKFPFVINITYKQSLIHEKNVVAALHKTTHGWCDQLAIHRVLLRVEADKNHHQSPPCVVAHVLYLPVGSNYII